jgi:signal transduction histidine kinase
VLKPVSLGPLLAALVTEIAVQTRREIFFHNKLAASTIMGDSLRLRDAFYRILDNAVRYSSPEAPVFVTLDSDESAGMAAVRIKDYGPGIAEEIMPLLFQPFGLGKARLTGSVPGNGMSLFIVKTIIESHHGTINVLSKPKEGTTFITSIPLIVSEG